MICPPDRVKWVRGWTPRRAA